MPVLILFIVKNWRASLIAVAIAALVAGALYERHYLIGEGATEALQKVKDANHVEENRAAAAAKTVDDCAALGGDWDRAVGVCKPAAR